MRYVYHFKTADNQRHEGELDAKDRETAFAELRARGIRAIKVEPKTNARFEALRIRWWIVGIVGILGVAISLVLVHGSNPQAPSIGGISDDAQFIALTKQVELLRNEHRSALGKLKIEWARNYALIENMADVSSITAQLERGQDVVKYSRMRATDIFKDILILFPEKKVHERQAAQRMYGALMEELDLDEYNLSCAYMAVSILSENRGKWHEEKGKIVWTDEKLKREFEPFATDSDAATARWRRDFNSATIESGINELPPRNERN